MHRVDADPSGLRAGWVALVEACHAMRGRRLPWAATAFGSGVGLYFVLPQEPTASEAWALGAVLAALLALTALWRASIGLLPLMAALVVAGLLAGVARTQLVWGPVLDFRYYGAVEGRVLLVDRSASGAVRVTLDHVRLDRVTPQETPRRVRLSLHGDVPARPEPGQWVMTTAHLSAPNGPAEPHGFDFGRHAWFQKLGAVGYARVALLQADAPDRGVALAISRLRDHISEGLRARMPGPRGEVAAAITTGDRSGLPEDVVEALRVSNLAHLLAISGLHMGLLVGFVFWMSRGGLALWPRIALRYPTRAWAAAIALPFATFYLILSGGSVATQRAFIMAAVMLVAILVGRRALSLRSVAIAALIVLALRPESLPGPGFQMSFAATAALVIAFRALSDWTLRSGRKGWMSGWRGAVLSLLISSVVAGAATAPFAALHFNRIGQLGVLANMLAVPAMGAWVMPLLLIGLLLWPLGLEALPLWLAGQGIAWIIWVAEMVAGLPHAARLIAAPDPIVLPLLTLGMAVAACASGLRRGGGLALVLAAALIWHQSPRPDALIAGDGRIVGVMTGQGRWLSREAGAGFVAGIWLENDGDSAPQPAAAGRDPAGWVPGVPPIFALRGKTGLDAALEACARAKGWLVTPVKVEGRAPGCRIFDERALRPMGSLAIYAGGVEDGAPRILSAEAARGMRPWTPGYRAGLGRGARDISEDP